MHFGRWLLIALLCTAPTIASASTLGGDTLVPVTYPDPVSVPEPGTLSLLLAGIGGIAALRRRRHDKNDR